jgi:hypothetical protein
MTAKQELKTIEHKNRTWRNKFMREQSIWNEIAMQINSTKDKENKHWCLVMDLYRDKYLDNA